MRMREHRVKFGETLPILSKHYYGCPDYALVIYQHNRDIVADPNNIYPGQMLVIPHIPNAQRIFG